MAALTGCTGSESTLDDQNDTTTTSAASVATTQQAADSTVVSSTDTPRRPLPDRSVDQLLSNLWSELESTMAVTDAAVERSTNRCLEGTGFTYSTPSRGSEFHPGAVPPPWNFSTSSDDLAAQNGLAGGDSLDPAFEQALYGNIVGRWSQSPDETTPPYFAGALGGEIYDGCLPTAQLAIVGGGDPARSAQLIDFYYVLAGIEQEATRRAMANPGYQEARARWVACLEDRGYALSRFEPDETVFEEPPPWTEDEVSAANDCSASSGMRAIGDGQLKIHLRELWVRHQDLVAEYRTRLDEVRTRAQAS